MEYSISNIPIVKIYRSEEDRDGKPYMSKDKTDPITGKVKKGNPFTKVDIYIDPREVEDSEFEGKMTYFDYFDNTSSWDIGTPLTGVIKKNGKYFNFQMTQSQSKSVPLDIKELQNRVEKLEQAVFKSESSKAIEFTKAVLKEDTKEEDIEDGLPF